MIAVKELNQKTEGRVQKILKGYAYEYSITF